MKNKNGFTLVEILSIITVLGIIVMLVLPNIGGSLDEKKENELNKLIDIIENSAKVYHSFNSDVYKISVNTLIDEEYITTDMTNPKTGEKLDGCVNVVLDENDTYSYIYGSCDGVEVPFSVELGIGTPGQTFNEKYLSSTKIELVNPTSEKGDFKGWEIVKGNSILKGNTLIIGTTETILFAVWEKYGKLDVDYDGGTPGAELKPYYKTGEIIELLPPTREGYIFTGWTATGGSLSGNTFVMGKEDATITANYVALPNFANDDWSTIVAAVKSGNHPYEVGDTKEVNLGEILGTHTLRVANTTPCEGLSITSKTACGFVLEFVDVITTFNMNPAGEYSGTQYKYGTNLGGWPASAMRKYLNDIDTTSEEDGVIYNALPEELRAGIIDSYVVSGRGSTTIGDLENENAGVLESSNYWSNDKLYLLSTYEVWGSNPGGYDTSAENTITRQLDYYATYEGDGYTGVTTSSPNRAGAIKNNSSGSASWWWLRSATSNSDGDFYLVYSDGGWNYGGANYSIGLSPAFRLAN